MDKQTFKLMSLTLPASLQLSEDQCNENQSNKEQHFNSDRLERTTKRESVASQ